MLDSMDAVLVATSVVLAASTIVSVSIQLERQYKTVGRLSLSKWFLVISAFFALVMTSLVCAAAAKGLGAAISPVEFMRRVTLQKLLVAAFPPYFLCNMFVKHAWLTFYYGLARTRAQRWFIHFMQFTAAGFGISSVLVVLLQCIPLSEVWHRAHAPDTEQSDAKCINLLAFFYSNAIIMIVNDVVMYMIPMVLLWKVEMLSGHRWGVYALFGVGGFVILASVFRLVAVHNIDTSDRLSENYALVYLWAAIENHVGICAACAGALKQKSVSTFEKVKRLSSDLRHRSWRMSATDHTTTTTTTTTVPGGIGAGHRRCSQSTEERKLYERAASLNSFTGMEDSVSNADNKDLAMRLELVELARSPERERVMLK